MGFLSSIGSIFKPVTSIVGGILGLDSQKKANAANQAFADSQFNFQKDYIQNQIQWKVEDAKKAGVHPMAALGIQSPGFSPVSSTQQPLDYSWVGDLGQSANYAATKAKTTPQQQQMIDLQIRGLELDNEYKQAQIDQMKVDTLASSIASNQAFNSPSAPSLTGKDTLIEGQNDSPFMDKPIIRDGWLLDEKGRKISIIPSDALKGRTEDVLGVEWLPFIGSAYRDAKARIIGHEVNGHWWHGLDKGYLPYPPKSKGKKYVKVSSYYDNSYRY